MKSFFFLSLEPFIYKSFNSCLAILLVIQSLEMEGKASMFSFYLFFIYFKLMHFFNFYSIIYFGLIFFYYFEFLSAESKTHLLYMLFLGIKLTKDSSPRPIFCKIDANLPLYLQAGLILHSKSQGLKLLSNIISNPKSSKDLGSLL